MKKDKKNKLILLIGAGVIVLASIILGIIYLVSNDKSYSYSEKKWMNENANNIVDIYVQSDLPVFSYNGSGVFYDYLSSLEKDTGIEFNIVYEPVGKYAMTLKNSNSNAVTFFKDHYVVISPDSKTISSLNDLKGTTVGILNSDISAVQQYLSDYTGITYKGYATFEDLKVGFSSGASDTAIVPLYLAINSILSENYVIDYHIDGFNAYYTLSLSDNAELNGIMQKFYDRWSEKSNEKRNEHLVSIYYKSAGYTELEKDSIVNDDFIVGYVDNLPFEGIVNNTFTGLSSAYLMGFADLSGATYKYVSYKTVDDLIIALSSKKIDIAANYYSINSDLYDNSKTYSTGEYVVLTHADNPIALETLSTLSGANVVMLSKMNLTAQIKAKKLFNVLEYNGTKELFKNIDKESIILVEKDFYEYYKDKQFKNYAVKFSDEIKTNNTFLLNKENAPFNKLYNFYMSLNSEKEMRSLSTKKIYSDERNNVILSFIIRNLFYIIISLLAIGFIFYKIAHKVRLSKRIKKEDKLLYIDVMTNLKNRNYLNDNINYWSENKVYPQAILVVDLNKVKILNDKFGHEEGDKQIKAAANALVKTQRENSEIMRTNGNEFMVYLVGYDEKMILSYIHKLTRELKASLPYDEYGVSLGYSMINSELSTIDDAINEALSMMRKNKGSN